MVRRESWLYGLAFLVVLGLGVVLIGPRLLRLRGGGGGASEAPSPDALPHVPTSSPAETPEAAPWVPLSVRGAGGAPLRGPLKDVVGATSRWDTPRDAREVEIAVRPTGSEVAFGAAGHQWRVVPLSDIRPGAVVMLEAAAAPVIVRVREPDGLPAAGVPVEVMPSLPGPRRATGEGGAVVLDDLPPGLVIVRVGGVVRRGPTLRLSAGDDRDVSAVLEPAWRVLGRVVDLDGRAVEGARVEGFGAGTRLGVPTTTDADGRFVWRGPVAPALSIRLVQEGVAVVHVKAVPPDRGTLTTDVGTVRLGEPSAVLEGRVLSATTSTAATLTVEPQVAAVLRELFGAETVLGSATSVPVGRDGAFRLTDLRSRVPLRVSIRGGGLPFDDVILPGPGERLVREYAPPTGVVLQGVVRDEVADAPAAGVRLRISTAPADLDLDLPGDRVVITDGGGRFRIDGLPGGSVYVRAHVPDRRTLLREIVLPRGTTPLTLPLEPATSPPERRITGVVLDDRGHPLEGVAVRAAGRVTKTDRAGAFQLDDVEGFEDVVLVDVGFAAGTRRITEDVDPTDYVAGSRRRVSPGGDPVRLVLARAASLGFRVLDGLDDVPLAFVHVVLLAEKGQVIVDRTVALRDGHVRLDGLLPDGSTLAVLGRRHRLIRPVVLAAGEETHLGTLRLARGIHVSGRVVDPEERPIAGAQLSGVEAGWLHRRGRDPTTERELALRHVTTDAEGRFEMDGFDPRKPAMIAVWAPGFAPAARRVVLPKFSDSAHAELRVELVRGGFLAVELVETGTDRPVSGALFDLEDDRNESDYLDLLRRGMIAGAVGSDDDWRRASRHYLMERREGHYRIGPIVPGPYRVWVDRPGFAAIERKLTILDPEDAIVSHTDGTTRSLTETLHLTWEMEPGR